MLDLETSWFLRKGHNMNKTSAAKIFYEKYLELKEGDKQIVSRITNKLLQVNLLTRKKVADATDYRFILAYKEVFESFFILMDFSLNIRRSEEVIFIKNESVYNHLRLRKEDSILILVIRLLFQKKFAFITLDENVEVYLSEIHNELSIIGILDNKRMTKERLKSSLMMLKNYNIIDYIDKSLADDARIKIYPTVMFVTDLGEIKNVVELLEGYTQGGQYEDIEEN